MSFLRFACVIIGLLLVGRPTGLSGQDPDPVVHAVLFYSPTCPHCHQVINEQMIPLQNRYGNRLVILGLDISQSWANGLWWEAIRHYEVPEDDWGVPFLVVGGEVMVGADVIAARFPGMIEEGLGAGGIDLPGFPPFLRFLQEQDILDPRYPDRLIALQAAAGEGEGGVSGADSVPAGVGETAAGRTDTGAAEPVDSAAEATDTVLPRLVETRAEGSPADTAGLVERAGGGGEEVTADTSLEDVSGARDPGPEAVPLGDVAPDSPSTGAAEPRAPAPGDSAGFLGMEAASRNLESVTAWDRFRMDPAGNSLSVTVLLGMLLSLALRGYPPRVKGGLWPSWVLPALVVAGAGVAAYLSFIEVTQAEAFCGPVGDCNTVNQSEYARLFGVLPVGLLGLAGYGLILALWVLQRRSSSGISRAATLGVWVAALVGTVFSGYLTFLEPFVIGATCIWCLTSAVIMTLILWASGPAAAAGWSLEK